MSYIEFRDVKKVYKTGSVNVTALAVFENEDVFFIHAEALGHFLVEAEHAVFAVNGDEELRLDQSVEHHELVTVCVA